MVIVDRYRRVGDRRLGRQIHCPHERLRGAEFEREIHMARGDKIDSVCVFIELRRREGNIIQTDGQLIVLLREVQLHLLLLTRRGRMPVESRARFAA